MNAQIARLRALVGTGMPKKSLVEVENLLQILEAQLMEPLELLRRDWENPDDQVIGEFSPDTDTLIVIQLRGKDNYYIRRYFRTTLSWDISADLNIAPAAEVVSYLLGYLPPPKEDLR